MKYYLSTAGRKCCKGCTWLLSLAQQENGYDLIQFKRGVSENRELMKLYPGEPAIILDTGEFFIGDATGRPIHINPSGSVLPAVGNILCIRNNGNTVEWEQGDEVIVRYEDMITSDTLPPKNSDEGRYSCAVIIDDSDIAVGIAIVTEWCVDDNAAKFIVGYFNPLSEFTDEDVDSIISRAKQRLYG